MTCEEALKRLFEVVDKEASQYDVDEVQKHLEQCESCMARYEFEYMFKTFVKDKAASPEKIDRLKGRILNRIDEESEGQSIRKMGPFRFAAVAVAAAFALVLCIGAAFWAAGYYRYSVFIHPFEENYFRGEMPVLAANVSDGDFNPCSPEIMQFISNDLSMTFGDVQTAGFNLIGSAFDTIRNHRFVHFRFVRGGMPVSLYVGDKNGVELPGFEEIKVGSRSVYTYYCDGCQMIYWYCGKSILIAVSEDKSLPLPEIIPAVYSI